RRMKMKKIISTENFLIGLDKEKDEAVLGGLELYDNPNIDDNTIEFDECSWFDEKSYFFDGMIYDAIKRYEHRYQTTVNNNDLIGTVGLWHGNPSGGVIFDSRDRKSTRLNSSHVSISYAVFCLKK